jgi:hypothetical protein
MSGEKMNVDEVVRLMTDAIGLQYRSVLAFTTAAGGIGGLEYRGLANDLWSFAEEEITDTRVLVEKLVALGGSTPDTVPQLVWHEDAVKLLRQIIEQEEELIEALHAVIPETGQEGRSEALEHLIEHVIMRKQRQVDLLARSIGKAEN